jgi:hypothetical protein
MGAKVRIREEKDDDRAQRRLTITSKSRKNSSKHRDDSVTTTMHGERVLIPVKSYRVDAEKDFQMDRTPSSPMNKSSRPISPTFSKTLVDESFLSRWGNYNRKTDTPTAGTLAIMGISRAVEKPTQAEDFDNDDVSRIVVNVTGMESQDSPPDGSRSSEASFPPESRVSQIQIAPPCDPKLPPVKRLFGNEEETLEMDADETTAVDENRESSIEERSHNDSEWDWGWREKTPPDTVSDPQDTIPPSTSSIDISISDSSSGVTSSSLRSLPLSHSSPTLSVSMGGCGKNDSECSSDIPSKAQMYFSSIIFIFFLFSDLFSCDILQ